MLINFAENVLFDKIAEDMKQTLLLLLSERGHGKSSSLKTIVKYVRENHPEICFKVLDVSLSWYNNSPIQWRQYVTRQALQQSRITNLTDCVYEMGELTPEERRAFAATLIQNDFQRAREAVKQGTETPWIIYIVEEANTMFGSYSFRRNDPYSAILQDFVSIGRNFNLGAILVSTAEIGELAPSIRRRRRIIYGRIESPSDLNQAKRYSKSLAETVKNQPRYHFTYQNRTERIKDTVKHTPTDYITETPVSNEPQFDSSWWVKFLGTIGIFFLFWSWLMTY